jgi:transcriptional regulator with XRE-family HTH domain
MHMLTKSPLTEWRENHGMTQAQLATACGIKISEVERIEAGKEGIVGELQDYLVEKGENVSELASRQSEFIAGEGFND